MSDKLGFLDSLFDVNGDGKVDDIDFMDDVAIFNMIQEDEEKEKEEENEFDPFDYDDDELDDELS